jgi:homoserine acetyltransferase
MGGMTALAYLVLHPGSARAHISISTAAQAQPFAIAIRSLQREAIRLDPNWNQGHYDESRYPEAGMSIARKLGVITYRSAMEWVGRFARIRLIPSSAKTIRSARSSRSNPTWSATRAGSCAVLIRIAIFTCPEPVTGSTLPNMAMAA